MIRSPHVQVRDRFGEEVDRAGSVNAVMESLYDLHRQRDFDALPQTILGVVSRLIASDSALFLRIDPATQSYSFVSLPPGALERLDHKEASRLHLRDHPLAAHFLKRRDARAWCLHDLVSREQFSRRELYRSVYRSLGIEFQMVMLVPYPDRTPRAIVLNRRTTQFSEAERSLLEGLWTHIVLVARTARAASRRRSVLELDRLNVGRGVVVLDRSGRVDLCTEQARVWLTRYCVESFSRREIKTLPPVVAGWVKSAFSDPTLHLRGIPDPIEPLILRRGEQYLALRLVADHGRGQHLVLMEEAAMHAPPDLLQGLGLTPCEAEVLAWVAQSKTNREAGIILGMSTRTVQKHMERIFSKLGVETRTAAILKAWQASRFAALAPRAG